MRREISREAFRAHLVSLATLLVTVRLHYRRYRLHDACAFILILKAIHPPSTNIRIHSRRARKDAIGLRHIRPRVGAPIDIRAIRCVMTARMPLINSFSTTAAHDFRYEDGHSELDMQLDDVSDGSKLNVAKIIKSALQPQIGLGYWRSATRKLTRMGWVG